MSTDPALVSGQTMVYHPLPTHNPCSAVGEHLGTHRRAQSSQDVCLHRRQHAAWPSLPLQQTELHILPAVEEEALQGASKAARGVTCFSRRGLNEDQRLFRQWPSTPASKARVCPCKHCPRAHLLPGCGRLPLRAPEQLPQRTSVVW